MKTEWRDDGLKGQKIYTITMDWHEIQQATLTEEESAQVGQLEISTSIADEIHVVEIFARAIERNSQISSGNVPR